MNCYLLHQKYFVQNDSSFSSFLVMSASPPSKHLFFRGFFCNIFSQRHIKNSQCLKMVKILEKNFKRSNRIVYVLQVYLNYILKYQWVTEEEVVS